jgi:hypothetical protein
VKWPGEERSSNKRKKFLDHSFKQFYMWMLFAQMPAQSRIWIYPASQRLSVEAREKVQAHLEKKIRNWDSHGAPMKASAAVFHDQFVIIAADESHQRPSGCSIDQSVNWMRELGIELNVDFFDRSINLLQRDEVVSIPLPMLKKAVENSVIKPETIVFNHTISNLSQLENYWKLPASASWMSRYFPLTMV